VKNPSVSHFLDIYVLISNMEHTLDRNDTYTPLL